MKNNHLPDNLSKDIYFEPNYVKLFEKLGEGKVTSFTFKKATNVANYTFLLNSINSLGFNLQSNYFDIQSAYGYNGIITNTFETSFIDDFYDAFDDYCTQNNIIAEFVRFHPLLENQKFSLSHLRVILDRETVALDLNQSYNEIWSNEYSSKNRNMIRKAQNLGYLCKILTNLSIAEIDQFISIYYNNMERVGADKYYFFNKEFFYNTFSYLREYVYLFNILDNKAQVVCSSIFFHYGDFFHYHLSGKSEKADNSVNNFLIDEAIKFAQSKSAKSFHFGGGRSNAPDDSLLKFKSNFSKTRLPFYIGKKIHNQEVYEDIVKQWEAKFPEKKEKFKNHILKYRF